MQPTPRITVLTSLFRCASYLHGYLDSVMAVVGLENIEILLLHNHPSEEELAIIETHPAMKHPSLRHIIIPEREGLYATWNRGIRMARGKYIAVWNVDDIRTPDSLLTQANALDVNTSAMLSYGSFIGTQSYGETTGTHYNFPEYSRWAFMRTCYLTPFPMWRASVHSNIGYFDESYRSAGDYDFQLRLAYNHHFVKVPSVTGYYLEAPETGISKTGNINDIERTVCELRYAMYDKLNLIYVRPALAYSLNTMTWNMETHRLSNSMKGLHMFRFSRTVLAPLSLLRMPINIARYIKHKVLPKLRRYMQHATTDTIVHNTN